MGKLLKAQLEEQLRNSEEQIELKEAEIWELRAAYATMKRTWRQEAEKAISKSLEQYHGRANREE